MKQELKCRAATSDLPTKYLVDGGRFESNFSNQVVSKEARYNRELIPGITASGWKAQLFKIEIRCRGFWHHTVPALFNYFGLERKKKKQALQDTAL